MPSTADSSSSKKSTKPPKKSTSSSKKAKKSDPPPTAGPSQPRKKPAIVEGDDSFHQAVEASKQQDPPKKQPEEVDNEDELQKALEISKAQSTPAPRTTSDSDDDEYLRRMIEESERQYKEDLNKAKERAEEAEKIAKWEADCLSESKRLIKVEKEKRREREKALAEEDKVLMKGVKALALQDERGKQFMRDKDKAYRDRRAKEIKEEAKQSRRAEIAEREAEARNEGQRLQDENDPQFQAMLRQVQAASLGDASKPNLCDDGLPERNRPPTYGDLSETHKKRPKSLEWTTTTRAYSDAGTLLEITPEVRKEMVEYRLKTIMDREELLMGGKPPEYEEVEPSKEELIARAKKEAKEKASARKRPTGHVWNMATAVAGYTPEQARQGVQEYQAQADRIYGVRRGSWARQDATGAADPGRLNRERAKRAAAPHNAPFAGIVPGSHAPGSSSRRRRNRE